MGLTGRGEGHGKLLLFGEHAAVLGYPALGLALDAGISVELEADGSRSSWELDRAGETGPGEGQAATALREVLSRIAAIVTDFPAGGLARTRSGLPMGRGFGSSAAFCVALSEAALALAGRAGVTAATRATMVGDRVALWRIAHKAEAYFHGTPSGIDTGLAALGGCIAFAPDPPGLPAWHRLSPPSLHFLVGSLPREASARTLIAGIREAGLRKGSPEALALARLGACSSEAIALLEGDPARPDGDAQSAWMAASSATARAIGELAKTAHHDLASLGLVDPGVAALLARAEAQGALGGKMSGAGGGGAFWLLYAGRAEAMAGKSELQSEAEKRGLATELSLEVLSTS
ncbi:MAG: hypothetical protein WCQ50_04320 [Spirochaetota bacterium]